MECCCQGLHNGLGRRELNTLLCGQVHCVSPGSNTPFVKMISGVRNGPYKDRIEKILEIFNEISDDRRGGLFLSLKNLRKSGLHGDLKINNVAFDLADNTIVKAFFDLDTFGEDDIWTTDVGDGGRSACLVIGEDIWEQGFDIMDMIRNPDMAIDKRIAEEIVEGYAEMIRQIREKRPDLRAIVPHYFDMDLAEIRVNLYRDIAIFYFELGLRFFMDFITEWVNSNINEGGITGVRRHNPYFKQPSQVEETMPDKLLRLAEVQFGAGVLMLRKLRDRFGLEEFGIDPDELPMPIGWTQDVVAAGWLQIAGETPIKTIQNVMEEETRASPAGFEWVSNHEAFNRKLADAVAKNGENTVIFISLSAGKGTRWERYLILDLLKQHDLLQELEERLISLVGETKTLEILASDTAMFNSPDFEKAGRLILEERGFAGQIIPKVIYPIESNGFDGKPFCLRGIEAAGDGPKLVVVGYEADKVRNTIGEKDSEAEFVIQPGFSDTDSFIVPGKWYLGTGYALAQITRAVPSSFKGKVLVTMGDIPFLDREVIEAVKNVYNSVQTENPNVKALMVLGRISTDPIEAGYGRILYRDVLGKNGTNYKVLDRIIETKDIYRLIALSLGREHIDKEELPTLQKEKTDKVELIKKAGADEEIGKLLAILGGRFDFNRKVVTLENEDGFSQQQIRQRKQLDVVLARYGLLRKKITGELLDGWDLIEICDYNPAIYIFDYAAMATALLSLKNNNAAREFYATVIPETLEEQGCLTVCQDLGNNAWKVDGIDTLSMLEAKIADIIKTGQLNGTTTMASGETIIDKALGEAVLVIGLTIPQAMVRGFAEQGFELNKNLFIANTIEAARAILLANEAQFVIYTFNFTGGGITLDTEEISAIPIQDSSEIADKLEQARASAKGVETEV